MSDFVNNGWSVYIAAVVIVSLLACLGLLIVASKRKAMASDNTTGHVWDGDLRELNNPLPRWWMGLFVITVVFAALYLVLYPGLGNFAGKLGWTSTGQWEAEQAKAQAAMAPLYAKFVSQTPEALAKDPQAMAIGERLYINNCAQCHGSDAKGSKGFPNLTLPVASRLATDSFDSVKATIVNGRQGVMTPMAAALGSSEDVKNVANYVLSLSGSPHNELAAQLGKPKFAVCAACHGPDGKGMIAMINNGKTNVMPPQGARMTADQIYVLAAYVWNLAQGGAAQ